mgnify:CR=1 FL=1
MARSNHPNIAVSDAPAAEAAARVSGRRAAGLNLLVDLCPRQRTKNLLIFAALIFAQRLFDLRTAAQSLAAFVIFCDLSGVVYLVNDVMDRESDRRHPLKSHRPIASGALSVRAALIAATVLGAAGLAGAFALSRMFGLVAVGYIALQGLYSGPLKHIVVLAVLTAPMSRMSVT